MTTTTDLSKATLTTKMQADSKINDFYIEEAYWFFGLPLFVAMVEKANYDSGIIQNSIESNDLMVIFDDNDALIDFFNANQKELMSFIEHDGNQIVGMDHLKSNLEYYCKLKFDDIWEAVHDNSDPLLNNLNFIKGIVGYSYSRLMKSMKDVQSASW